MENEFKSMAMGIDRRPPSKCTKDLLGVVTLMGCWKVHAMKTAHRKLPPTGWAFLLCLNGRLYALQAKNMATNS